MWGEGNAQRENTMKYLNTLVETLRAEEAEEREIQDTRNAAVHCYLSELQDYIRQCTSSTGDFIGGNLWEKNRLAEMFKGL